MPQPPHAAAAPSDPPVARHDGIRTTAAPPEADLAVDVRGLRCSYGGTEVVKGIDLSVRRGEIFALLGTNGAGKTTTLDVIQGYRTPTAGSVAVLGLHPVKDGRVLRRCAGFMMQEAGFIPEMTVRETVSMWRDLSSRRDDVEAALTRVDLTHKAAARVESLSGGERRRLDLALATWGAPDLVVLDEPTTGLDPESRSTLWHLVTDLKRGGATVIVTTHYLDEAQALADSVAIMHRGEVAVQGRLADVLRSRPTTIEATVEGRARAVAVALPGWAVTSRAGQVAVALETTDVHAAVVGLTGAVTTTGSRLVDLTVRPATLEDLFHAVRAETGSLARAATDVAATALAGAPTESPRP